MRGGRKTPPPPFFESKENGMKDFDESRFNSAEDEAGFLAWKRRKRREAIIEAVCAVIGVALFALAVKLWFVAEGFTPCAN